MLWRDIGSFSLKLNVKGAQTRQKCLCQERPAVLILSSLQTESFGLWK